MVETITSVLRVRASLSDRQRVWREITSSFDRWSRSAPTVAVSVVFGAAAATIIVAALYAVDLIVGRVISWLLGA